MELTDLQQAFLAELYKVRFVDFDGALHYGDWTTENGYSQRDVDHCFNVLSEAGLVEAYALGRTATLTSSGALFVEKHKLFDRDVIEHQEQFRTEFLVALANVRDENGFNAAADWESTVHQIGASAADFHTNYQILTDGGYIESQAVRTFHITSLGYSIIEEYREKVKHQQEFERLQNASGMTETERGTAFTELLKSKCLKDEWQCEMVALEAEGAETLVFYRDLNFFLAECVWTETELSRMTVRKLREQITSRPGTYGCVFSMAPVPADAISEAQRHLETACIIIFGEQDLSELFSGGTLTDSVNAKMVNARIRRSIQAK